MSTTKLTLGVAGIVLVATFGSLFLLQNRVKQLSDENRRLRVETEAVPALRQELEGLRQVKIDQAEMERLRGLESEVLRLRARVNSGQRTESEVAELKSELARQKQAQPAGVPFVGAVREATKGLMEQQMQGRLMRMKTKLNLTPQQEQAITDILHQQAEQGAQVAQKMFSGNLSRDEVAETGRASVDTEAEIKAVLSPEQQAAYQEFKDEERSGTARLAANAEMLQLQNAVGLSPEQQDQVFAALYEQTMTQLSGENRPSPDGNVESMLEQQLNRKANALQDVLTPEQLEIYRKMQESQMKMIRTMMPKASELAPEPGASPTSQP